MDSPIFSWIFCAILIFSLLWLDWKIFQQKGKEIRRSKALLWSGFWVVLALFFNGYVYLSRGGEAALTFFTGYLVEKSLSIDNLFLFFLIFAHFKISLRFQQRVLFQGIFGALILRFVLIFAGIELLEALSWVKYLFGAFLAYSGIRFMVQKTEKLERSWFLSWIRKCFPVTQELHGSAFFVREEGKRYATPLFLALIVIECFDLLFALDSVPAILALTRDPFIVYSSNIFAILGLRALYFVVAEAMGLFHYLKFGLGAVLILMGVKMVYPIPTSIALGFMLGILAISILTSLKKR
jgi:tellurite resistance protein TerC